MYKIHKLRFTVFGQGVKLMMLLMCKNEVFATVTVCDVNLF
jgi:hypothetical protein